jgi:hypothetical protein
MNDRAAMTETRATTPFRFISCLELCEALGVLATDEQRLLELIEEVPLDSIHYHTHSYLLRHVYLQGLYPNDFATWVTANVHDPLLGERLAVIDPFEFQDLPSLRAEIADIIGDHLTHLKHVPRVVTGEPFEFVRSHIIDVDLNMSAWTLQEFCACVATIDAGALYNHVCEARLRKGHLMGDFSCWLGASEGLHLPDLAKEVMRIGALGLGLEGIRRAVGLCGRTLAAT